MKLRSTPAWLYSLICSATTINSQLNICLCLICMAVVLLCSPNTPTYWCSQHIHCRSHMNFTVYLNVFAHQLQITPSRQRFKNVFVCWIWFYDNIGLDCSSFSYVTIHCPMFVCPWKRRQKEFWKWSLFTATQLHDMTAKTECLFLLFSV